MGTRNLTSTYDPVNPKRYLDFEEQEDLERMLNACAENRERLKANEANFIVDMATRYESYGERLVVSKKQWDWLQGIYTNTLYGRASA